MKPNLDSSPKRSITVLEGTIYFGKQALITPLNIFHERKIMELITLAENRQGRRLKRGEVLRIIEIVENGLKLKTT